MRTMKIALVLVVALLVSVSYAKKKKDTGITYTGGTTATVTTPAAPSQTSLLSNIPVVQGFAQWQKWVQDEVKVVSDATYGNVLQFSRSDAGNNGGPAGIVQSMNATAFQASIYLELIGKVVKERSGNIANTNPQWFPEGAVQVRVKYLAANNQAKEWYHGFYSGTIAGADAADFTKVNANEWFTYTSPDLKALPGGISKITEIRVYGFGWEFTGQVAKIDLYTTD